VGVAQVRDLTHFTKKKSETSKVSVKCSEPRSRRNKGVVLRARVDSLRLYRVWQEFTLEASRNQISTGLLCNMIEKGEFGKF
jgi:hypothetical protein